MTADASALFERALGDDWAELHPQIRDRYGLVAGEHREAVGRGRMARLRRGLLAVPALWLGTLDDFLFPEAGRNVPFTITTEAFVDGNGHEALFLRRTFETDPPRTFVDTLRWNPARDCLTDFFGRHGFVVADLHLAADDGTLVLELGAQWVRVGGHYVRLPGSLAVDATLEDWYDDEAEEFRVAATIRNPLVGEVFGYRGAFENEFRPVDAASTTASQLVDADLPGENA